MKYILLFTLSLGLISCAQTSHKSVSIAPDRTVAQVGLVFKQREIVKRNFYSADEEHIYYLEAQSTSTSDADQLLRDACSRKAKSSIVELKGTSKIPINDLYLTKFEKIKRNNMEFAQYQVGGFCHFYPRSTNSQ